MNTAYIIAEYNPFHNGHMYHAVQTRKMLQADCVVAIMSGNYVQRGEQAITDKFLRAEAAVKCGVDLVVELPVKYSVSNASRFARGGIATAEAFGLPGTVSFGASASLRQLEETKRLITDDFFLQSVSALSQSSGKTYPAATDHLLRREGYPEQAELLKDPNNILAIEYLKFIEKTDLLLACAVKRPKENPHDAMVPNENMASAALIREQIYRCEETVSPCATPSEWLSWIPSQEQSVLLQAIREKRLPSDRQKFDVACFSRLLMMEPDDFIRLDNVNHGLENRIVQAIRESTSMKEAVSLIKSKRYTMARLRQVLIAAALGITKQDVLSDPHYVRVLAFNDTGRQLLASVRKTASVPIITNLSDVSSVEPCARDVAIEYAADKLYDLCLPTPRGGNRPFLDHPFYKKSVD